jgi:ketosteroid isomerase-like protein
MRKHAVATVRVATGIALFALTACATIAGPSADTDAAAIRQIWASYVAAAETGDSTSWLALWDQGGIQLRPDAPARTYEELLAQVPAAFKARTDANQMKMVIDAQEIVVAGAWGYSRGLYTQDLTNRSTGAKTRVDGKFLTIFKRQADGSWRIYRDCFNSNVAPAK